MIVQKYGGTSLGTPKRMLSVSSIIKENFKNQKIIVVVSAMSSKIKNEGVTSKLIQAADYAIQEQEKYLNIIKELKIFHIEHSKQTISNNNIKNETTNYISTLFHKLTQFFDALTVIRELSPLSSDRVVRVGEKLSAMILSQILKDQNINASFVDLSYIAPKNYTNPNQEFYSKLEQNLQKLLTELLKNKQLPILTGFIGEIPGGIMQSIGRGYTDYTASIAASIMNANELQIWKEIDGIFTADPKIVKNANVLPVITNTEAAELSYFGSEVIHPFTMERVAKTGINVRIKNTLKPKIPGTLITNKQNHNTKTVKSITAKRNITLINIHSNRMLLAYGFMAKIFRIFEKYGVIIDLISTSEVSVSLTIDKYSNIDALKDELSQIGELSIHKNKTILSIVGQKMHKTIGIAGKMFSCLSKENINIEVISQGASEINISCVIKNEDTNKAIIAIHKHFIEN